MDGHFPAVLWIFSSGSAERNTSRALGLVLMEPVHRLVVLLILSVTIHSLLPTLDLPQKNNRHTRKHGVTYPNAILARTNNKTASIQKAIQSLIHPYIHFWVIALPPSIL